MDGTLTIPSLNFAAMRAALGIQADVDIVRYMTQLEGEEKRKAEQIVKEMEHEAMMNMKIQPGFSDIMAFLDTHEILKGILTRNNMAPVQHLLDTTGVSFAKIVTRDCFQPSKPAPDPLLHICADTWKLSPQCTMMVGDHLDDLLCGRAANTVTVLLSNHNNKSFESHADIVISSLADLVPILEKGFTVEERKGGPLRSKQ